jgi:putative transposase
LLKDYKTPEQILGANGLMGELTRRLVERATSGELTAHLGYEKGDPTGRNSGNSRNGTQPKTVQTDHGPQDVQIRAIAMARLSQCFCPSGNGVWAISMI